MKFFYYFGKKRLCTVTYLRNITMDTREVKELLLIINNNN